MNDSGRIIMGKLYDLYDEGRYRDVIAAAQSLSWTDLPDCALKANYLVGSAQFQVKLYAESHRSFVQLCHFDQKMNYRFYLARSFLPLKKLTDAELEFNFSLNEVQASADPTCKMNKFQGYFIYTQALLDFGFQEEAVQKFLDLDRLYQSMSARHESELFYASIPSFQEFFGLGDRVFIRADRAQERKVWKRQWQEQLGQEAPMPELLSIKSGG